MNRKIGVVLLAVFAVLCLSFAACDVQMGTGLTKAETLQAYIFEYDGQIVKEDFILPRRIGDYRAQWTSDSTNVVLQQRDSDYLAQVTVPDADETVTLTVDLRGATKTFTVRLAAITVQDILDNFNFIQNRGTVYEDFELPTESTYLGKTATITWSVDDTASQGYISVVDNTLCKVIPSSLNPEVRINATFAYNGTSATTYFRFTVSEKMEHLQEVNYWYTNTGVSITMKGYVVEIATEWSATYNNVSLYMVDENLDAGYYLYRVGCTAENAALLAPGVYVTAEGTTNTNYNGLIETNAGGTLTVDPTKTIDLSTTVYALDNDAISGAPALTYNQSRLVSLSNWEVSSVYATAPTAGSTSTMFTLKKGGASITVAISKYLEGAYAPNANDATWNALVEKYNQIKAAVDGGETVVVSVTGILGNYKGAQILPLSADDIVIGGTVGENDTVAGLAVKAAMEEVNAKFEALPSLITGATSVALDAQVGDVEVSYRLLGTRSSFAIAEDQLVITPAAAEVATVQATFTYGDNVYTANTFYTMQAEDLDDQGKANWEIRNFEVVSSIVAADEYELPTANFFDNAVVEWTTTAPYAAISGNTLTIAGLPLEATRMELIVTVTVNQAVATSAYYVNVSAMDANVPAYVDGLDEGEYYMALYQANLGQTLYITGTVSSNEFLETTTDYTQACKVVVTASGEGYTIQINGKYLEVYENANGSDRITLLDASSGSVWTYDTANQAIVFPHEGTTFYLNAYNTYTTVGVSSISYASSGFAAQLVSGVTTATAQDVLDGIMASLTTTVDGDFALDYKATWEVVSGEGIVIEGNTAKVTATSVEQTVVLKATVTYAGETVSQEVQFTIPATNPAPYDGEYVYGLYQGNASVSKWLYVKAEIVSDRYLATTENPAEAATVQLVTATDVEGYRILIDGKYLEVGVNSAGKNAIILSETSTGVWQWNNSACVMTWTMDGAEYYIGTYNTFTTLSVSNVSYITGNNADSIGVSQFVAQFLRHAPAEGTYIYGLYQANNAETIYLNGEMSGHYLATTTNASEAAQVTLTKSGNGYVIAVGGKYLNVYKSGTYTNVGYVDASPVVWYWNDQAGVMYTNVEGTDYYLGAYRTYSTISASRLTYVTGDNLADVGVSQFVLKFYLAPEAPVCDSHVDDNNDGVCDVCGEQMPSSEQTTVSVTIADYADTNSWVNGTQYATVVIDANVTATAAGGGNTGKYYTTGENWRLYQGESATLTIAANDGYKIVSVKVTYTVDKTGVLLSGDTQIATDTVVDVNAQTITFSVGNTGAATNGQVRVTAIEVVYVADGTSTTPGVDPDEPVVDPDEPVVDPDEPVTYEAKTLEEFLALTDSNEVFYQIEGVVVEITNTTYGNLYISDGANVVYLYGLASSVMTLNTNGTSFSNPQDFSTLNVQVGDHIVVYAAKGSFNGAAQAVGSGLASKAASTDLEKLYVAMYQVTLPEYVNASFAELPQVEGVTITWTSNSNAIVINNNVPTVTQTSEAQVVVLTAAYAYGTATQTVSYTVTVSAAVVVTGNITYSFTGTDSVISDFTWSNGYGSHSVFCSDGTAIEFSRASKQTGTITDRPVLATKATDPNAYVTVNMGATPINSVTFNVMQWGTKTFTSITVEYLNAEGAWVECGSLTTLSGECAVTGTFTSATQVRLNVYGTTEKNAQLGITSVVVTPVTAA